MDDDFLTKVDALAAAGHAQELDFDIVVARVAADRLATIDDASAERIERYAALIENALGKMNDADATRIAVALSANARTPERLLARAIARGGEPAAAVLTQAPRLSEALLLHRAEFGDAIEATAIAGRADLAPRVVDALARRQESETLHALAANPAIALDRGALVALTQRARFDDQLGKALLARGLTTSQATPLFIVADAAQRRQTMLEIQRDSLAGRGAGASPLESVRETALAEATRGDAKAFSATVARALRASRARIERLVEDAGGETLGLIAAAMGLSAAEATQPLLVLRPDLADIVDDPSSGVRLAMQTSAVAAYRILAAIVYGRESVPQQGEYGAAATRGARETRAPTEHAGLFAQAIKGR